MKPTETGDHRQFHASPPEPWPGVVLCETLDEGYRELARNLASSTGRPVVGLGDLDSIDEPVACVGPASEMTVDAMLRLADREIGFITGYDLADAKALVDRTIQYGSANRHPVASEVRDLDYSPTNEGNASQAVRRAELETGSVELLVLAGHGRECGFHLGDGVLCSKAGVNGKSGPAAPERLACATVEDECYTRMFRRDKRVAAAELEAAVVFLDSCQSFALGTNRFAGASSLALSLVSGNAVAVVASPWSHTIGHSNRIFKDAACAGLRLGECLALANQAARPHQIAARYLLLGDPALRLRRRPSSAVPSVEAIPAPVGPAALRSPAPSSWEDLIILGVAGTVIPATSPPDTEAAFDESIVRGLVELTLEAGYDWTDQWWSDAETSRAEQQMCPDCSSQFAEELDLVPRGGPGAVLSVLICPRCSVIREWLPDAPELTLLERPNLRGGLDMVSVAIQGDPGAEVWVGADVVSGNYHGLTSTTAPQQVILDASGRATQDFELSLSDDGSSDNVMRLKVFAASNGRISCRTFCVFKP